MLPSWKGKAIFDLVNNNFRLLHKNIAIGFTAKADASGGDLKVYDNSWIINGNSCFLYFNVAMITCESRCTRFDLESTQKKYGGLWILRTDYL